MKTNTRRWFLKTLAAISGTASIPAVAAVAVPAAVEAEVDPIANPQAVGIEICEALGLKASEISTLRIDVQAGALPTVTVEMCLRASRAKQLSETLRRYEIHERISGQAAIVDDTSLAATAREYTLGKEF